MSPYVKKAYVYYIDYRFSVQNKIKGFTMRFLTQETIDFQGSGFLNELTDAIEAYRQTNKSTNEAVKLALQLGGIIKARTNLAIRVNISPYWMGPCISPVDFSEHSVLFGKRFQGFLDGSDGEKLVSKIAKPLGTIDLARAKVDGVFKEVNFELTYPKEMLESDKYTSSEHAAVMLHEVGHGFTICEYLDRTTTINAALAGYDQAIKNNNSYSQKSIYLKALKTEFKLEDLDVDEASKITKAEVGAVVIVGAFKKQIRSELGSDLYDLTASEFIADQFAARFGAGRDIVTALDKRYDGRDIDYHTDLKFVLMEVVKASMLAISLSGIVLTIMAGIPLGAFAFTMLTMSSIGAFISDSKTKLPGSAYDGIHARYTRVKRDLIARLKVKGIKSDEAHRITEDIDTIDTILAGMKDRRQLLSYIVDIFSSAHRNGMKQKEFQQKLEALANSDLFVRAAEFNKLADHKAA